MRSFTDMRILVPLTVSIVSILFGSCSSEVAPPRVGHRGMVVSVHALSSEVGVEVMKQGGNAMDAAVATAFSLAVTHPSAGNIGGGGFLVYRGSTGESVAYDFRETAPASSFPEMWMVDGEYSSEKHHRSHAAVGVPGTVAGLYQAWEDHGSMPWKLLVEPAIELAGNGIEVTEGLAESLRQVLPRMQRYPASIKKFTYNGEPFRAGHIWKQPDLAATLQRIADAGPDGFYRGKTAELLVAEMEANDGLIGLEDLANYKPKARVPVRGTYRGYSIISMPPPSSGGVVLIQMLNLLEAFPLSETGFGTPDTLHLMAEVMRRGFEDRARHLGDPDFNPQMPLERLMSKAYADELRETINDSTASVSSLAGFVQIEESPETTHFSVVDQERNAVSLTYTLEAGYGSAIVVPGAGFLLNNEMGDFNAGPGLTNDRGLIGTPANLAEPGKRMLSSMTPTILEKDGELLMVTGSPGGRTIINTVLQTILNVVDHGMDAQAAVDAGRIHHQWMPDQLAYEAERFSQEALLGLQARGHQLVERTAGQGAAEVIIYRADSNHLEGGVDDRRPDGGIASW